MCFQSGLNILKQKNCIFCEYMNFHAVACPSEQTVEAEKEKGVQFKFNMFIYNPLYIIHRLGLRLTFKGLNTPS